MPKAIKVINTIFVTFTFSIPWCDLLEMGTEAFNDFIQKEWSSDGGKGHLENIDYTAKSLKGQALLIEVTAEAEEN